MGPVLLEVMLTNSWQKKLCDASYRMPEIDGVLENQVEEQNYFEANNA